MLRVLHILFRQSDAYGGIENFIENLYFHSDPSTIQFDWLFINRKAVRNEEQILERGGMVYHINLSHEDSMLRYLEGEKAIFGFLKLHKYEIVHIHNGSPVHLFFMSRGASKAAKRGGIKRIIVHAHSAQEISSFKYPRATVFLRDKIVKYATDFFACSELAAERTLPQSVYAQERYRIIRNGIDTEKYRFNQETRIEYRLQLKLGNNDFVIGHVGRFSWEKNHLFLIKVFEEVHKQDVDAKLLLVGDGQDMNKIKAICKEQELEDFVLFMGSRADTASLYQAIDVFVLPSIYEGFPVVGVEALTSGLGIVASTGITRELNYSGMVTYKSLSAAPAEWAESILSYKKYLRVDGRDAARQEGYDINSVAEHLTDLYLQLCRKSYN